MVLSYSCSKRPLKVVVHSRLTISWQDDLFSLTLYHVVQLLGVISMNMQCAHTLRDRWCVILVKKITDYGEQNKRWLKNNAVKSYNWHYYKLLFFFNYSRLFPSNEKLPRSWTNHVFVLLYVCCFLYLIAVTAACVYRGTDLVLGETLIVDDCTSCMCEEKNIRCEIRNCVSLPPLYCMKPIDIDGECCDICHPRE